MDQMQKFPLLNSYIDYWAGKKPGQPAMVQHEDNKTVTYKKMQSLISVLICPVRRATGKGFIPSDTPPVACG